jgi:hypothetical protein
VAVEAHARAAMHVCIVAPAVYARVRQATQPADVVTRPRRFAVYVQAMDCHDARAELAVD